MILMFARVRCAWLTQIPQFVSQFCALIRGSAAAAVLAAFFGSAEVAFSTTSEAMQGVSRTFHSFSEAAHQ